MIERVRETDDGGKQTHGAMKCKLRFTAPQLQALREEAEGGVEIDEEALEQILSRLGVAGAGGAGPMAAAAAVRVSDARLCRFPADRVAALLSRC